ncbi:hypothetical protein [Deinococcus fonticola]|uniref:hypothetical protein n=1 Tax=Deinococcus fonticola TaxID=2528713 RepID=UPI0030B8134F
MKAILRLLLAVCFLSMGCLGGGLAQAEVSLEGRTLLDREEERVVWRLNFPQAMGSLVEPVQFGGNSYVGVGPAVYAITAEGRVLGRADLPAPVSALDAASGAVRVTTQGKGYTEQFTLAAPEAGFFIPVQERAVLPPDPAVTQWLARVADHVPAGEVSRWTTLFPGNPFLALREAQERQKAGDSYGALNNVRRALSSQMPFPAWTGLAARLDTAGFPTAADLALEHAKRDAAARGIDPEIPVSREALKAYGDPARYAATLISQKRLPRAEVWMSFLRDLYPQFEGHDPLYQRYAALLEAQDRAGEAEEWRQFARSQRGGSLYNLGSEDTATLRDTARLATIALLISLLAALLTLSTRAWRTQQQDTRAFGGRYRSLWQRPMTRARLNLMSYASFSERLMLFILGAALLVTLGGWQWANQTRQGLLAPALNMGTYGGGWYAANVEDLNLRVTPDTAILAGLAAQLDGDSTTARESFLQAGQDACALNNLGVISQERDDKPQALEDYRAALALRPDLSAAQYNVGLNPASPGTDFQKKYRQGQPRLCYPDRRNLARMVSGDLSVTLRRDLLDPLGFLQGDPAGGRLGWVILAAFAHLLLLAFLLLIPRAATSARLGRPATYRFLVFLLPGSGLLNSPWGGMLLVTWAALVTTLLPLTGLVRFPLLLNPQAPTTHNLIFTALLGTYLINTLVLGLIEARYLRRKREEK